MGNSGAVENFMKWMREPGKMNQGKPGGGWVVFWFWGRCRPQRIEKGGPLVEGAGRDSCREKKSRGPAGGRDPIDDRK